MPLQNRVDPFGAIHAVPERGMFTGNRGVIHDPGTRTLLKRRWSTKTWIICTCDFRGRRRDLMGRNTSSGSAGWTELFFLDEVSALAAGHRPCFYCRYDRAKDFLGHFADAFGIAAPKAGEIDQKLHRERLASGGWPGALDREALDGLPEGAMIADGDVPYAIRRRQALRWTFGGYADQVPLNELDASHVRLVTPATTLAVLRQGYRPAWHASAP